ncbi:hypothetical protein PINS_up012901 [Pythium insidiosum]|nr:hypothetical protein PINS_up012901 [Pythium insidiosum]
MLGARASALQPKPLELFPSDVRGPPASARRSLQTGDEISTARLLGDERCSLRSTAERQALLLASAPLAHGSSSVSTAGATQLLASLRAKTLLDYGFMREFSLAKRKPVGERSLSRLSAQSVYRMRRTQMELDQQSRRLQAAQLQFQPPPLASESSNAGASDSRDTGDDHWRDSGSKGDGETRAPATAASPSSSPTGGGGRRRILSLRRVSACTSRAYPSARASTETAMSAQAHPHAPASNASSPAASSPYFPTLWTGETPPHRHRSVIVSSGGAALPRGLYRGSSASDVVPRQTSHPPSSSSSSSTATPRPPPARDSSSSSASPSTTRGCIVVDGLSEFDLRKCHPTAAVTKQHGYLQEQDIPRLSAETGYDRTELNALWARFKALCSIAQSPRGIDKDTFRRGLPQLSVEDQFFIDRVFDILDADGSGILEWSEFIEALSALEKGDALKRVLFLFRVYDLNGDGVVQRHDVVQFFLASLLIPATDDVVEHARQFVAKIFEAVGCGDRDGMRVDDAVRYMNEHPSADIYSVFGRTMVTTRTRLDVRQWAKDTVAIA